MGRRGPLLGALVLVVLLGGIAAVVLKHDQTPDRHASRTGDSAYHGALGGGDGKLSTHHPGRLDELPTPGHYLPLPQLQPARIERHPDPLVSSELMWAVNNAWRVG